MKTFLKVLAPATIVVGAGLLAGSAIAAPAGNLAPLQTSTSSAVDNVAYRYRRCWRHRGHLHCRREVRRYGYVAPYYYEPAPYYGYGYGPSIGFSFGGSRHHHGGHFHGGRGGHGHR